MRIFSQLSALVFVLCFARFSFALDLYQGEAPVANQSADARIAAMGKALLDVAVKVSGDATAANNSTVIAASGSPEKYVQGYEYRQEIVRVDGKPAIRLYLKGTFYPASISQLLGRAGLGSWGRDRPTVAVYVFSGDQPLGAEIMRAMQEKSSRRGINMRFPGGVSGAELDEATATRLASPGQNVLLGRIGDALWLSDGRQTERLSDASLDGLSDRLAAALARRAAAASNAPPEQLQTEVALVRSAGDYANVIKYLSALSGVKKLTVIGAQNDRLKLSLTVQGGAARLASAVNAGKSLRVISEEPSVLEVIN
jgi:uncharacterized protein